MNPTLVSASPEVRAFRARFVALLACDPSERFYKSFHFDDDQPSADELAELILRGTKRATAALLWTYESENKPLPTPGSLSIVTLWSGAPICVTTPRWSRLYLSNRSARISQLPRGKVTVRSSSGGVPTPLEATRNRMGRFRQQTVT